MSANEYLQAALFLGVLLALVKPLGAYMALVFSDTPNRVTRFGAGVENLLYRLCGIRRDQDMSWQRYALAMLMFNVLGLLFVYAIQRVQQWLPLNPQHFDAVSPDSAMNTAISFASNTNWQGYGGESTMSYLTQMLALNVQNFLSAATGIAVLIALIRGFTRRNAKTIGNFWVDMTRSVLYVLLPLSFVLALALVSQGVVQNFEPYRNVPLVEATTASETQKDAEGNALKDAAGKEIIKETQVTEQTLPFGPAASQIAIKQLGTNGGGFFNTNSAHPYENPTPLSNFLELLSILLIPAALCYTFGKMVGDRRQGWTLLAAMLVIFVPLVLACTYAEQAGNPALTALGVDQNVSALQAGGNMEGKETRFGIVNSTIWASATTAASNGSVNAMHDSFTPLGGLVPMWLMQLGEVIFGGVGCGLYGMLAFAIVAVFIAGLMVGRTPEYLGKKIEAFEMKMASLVVLIPCAMVLIGTAVAVLSASGVAGIANPGAHGFSEILYAFSSASNNNGSAFAGLSANTPFYNILLGIAMFLARFPLAIGMLAVAGSLAAKKTVPVSAGTLPTHTPLFATLLAITVVIIGALTFLPALALGPVAEFLIASGH
ncbi:potassium-transporting ATPase subunit KdpA [Pseudolysobacter antarcticus]|uniref:Potassium-transporting ATPase potassium-binding subunit n=1 Tax=Pseudolysobacter antarcticus TaxID=2511995 RepID=A0A411HIH7_9GAMM|nr:potassium-transporting ATPase subunit KdpA [Pseudolysobacter antarcticus]QBB70308.1 potassium-transporting ATPase subunit KdpA [Pseudolysobacter antarcticus]